jgi:hypothetical protein
MACILQKLHTEYEEKCMYTYTRISVTRSSQQTVSLETLGLREFVMKQERQFPLLRLHCSDLSQLSIR